MPTYVHTDTGERNVTVAGSVHDKRRAADDAWKLVDADDNGYVETAEPAVSDTKAEWVDYANSLGIDVDGKTKDQLIEAVRNHSST